MAPIIEEIVFRGLFEKKRLQVLFCVGVGVFIILFNNYYLLPLAILFVVLFNKNRGNFVFVIILNSIIFSAMHYSVEDFKVLSNSVSFFMKFGLSLFLSWIVINFGLKYSIIVHVCINFSIISLLILKLEFSSKASFYSESGDYTMKYQRVSMFNTDSKIRSDNKTYVIMSNSSISDLQKYLCRGKELKGVYLGKFNITIQRKKGSVKNIDCSSVNELLMKSNIESL